VDFTDPTDEKAGFAPPGERSSARRGAGTATELISAWQTGPATQKKKAFLVAGLELARRRQPYLRDGGVVRDVARHMDLCSDTEQILPFHPFNP
jgi:hypothetical protein